MLGQKQTSTSVGFQPSPFISRVDVFFHLEAFPPRSIVQPFWQRSHFYGLSVAKLTFLFCFASWAVEAKTNIVTWTMNNHDIFIAQTEYRGIFLVKSHLKSIPISPCYGFIPPIQTLNNNKTEFFWSLLYWVGCWDMTCVLEMNSTSVLI